MLNFRPMLAVNAKVADISFPMYGSIKLEGVRGVFTPQGLHARSMKAFPNPDMQEKFKELDEYCKENSCYIEGEFYRHGMAFNEISSICRRKFHEDSGRLHFYVFDFYNPQRPYQKFKDRSWEAKQIVGELNIKHLYCAQQVLHRKYDTVLAEYSAAVAQGYEGYVLKGLDCAYKYGRASRTEQQFFRIKPENTYDGVVLDITERMANLCESEENELGYLSKKQDKDMKEGTGMAACAIVNCPDFEGEIRVTLSRGLTDQDREVIWDSRADFIGKHLRFVGMPVKGMLPRSPRFDDWRPDLD